MPYNYLDSFTNINCHTYKKNSIKVTFTYNHYNDSIEIDNNNLNIENLTSNILQKKIEKRFFSDNDENVEDGNSNVKKQKISN